MKLHRVATRLRVQRVMRPSCCCRAVSRLMSGGGVRPGRIDWLSLKWNIVESHDGNAYRAVYTVRFAEAIYVPHAFQKKSPSGIRTALKDVDLVEQRLRAAQRDHQEHHGKAKR
jgi:hypothetical protein